MARRKYASSKAQYARLYDNPQELAPGASVMLWPNGQEGTIWVQSPDGRYGFEIEVGGVGPAGFGLTVTPFGLAPDTDVFVDANTEDGARNQVAQAHQVSLVQYHADARSQAFRRWVRKEGGYPCEACGTPHPEGKSLEWCSDACRDRMARAINSDRPVTERDA